MSHTYYSLLVHCVFSTKERQILIPAELKKKLWPYIAGIARMNDFKALAVCKTTRMYWSRFQPPSQLRKPYS
jgi:hypothetical protein